MAKSKTEVENVHEMIVGTSELSAIIGKSDRWIRQLTTDGLLKQTGRGKYILSEAIQAYIEHVQGGKEDDNKPRFIDEKTQHERIKREKAELELAKMRGEMHAAADVEEVMNQMLTAFRQKILSIPTKISPQIAGIDDVNVIKSRLTTILHEALSELSNYDPDMFQGEVGADTDDEG